MKDNDDPKWLEFRQMLLQFLSLEKSQLFLVKG